MPNAALSEAIKEAYASAPSEQIILHTLELRHPAFVDEAGQPVAIRVVRDTSDLWAPPVFTFSKTRQTASFVVALPSWITGSW